MLFCLLPLQDPTKQTEIDNFMVQQLDGTVNEWGWCKQKVSLCFLFVLLSLVTASFVAVLAIPFKLIGFSQY